jgi:predicted RecB family nuclease
MSGSTGGNLSVDSHSFNAMEAEDSSCASSVAIPFQRSLPQPPPLASPETTLEGIWLTDEVLFNYQRCRRRAFLDLYGNPEQRDAPSDYLLKLRQDSQEHQLAVIQSQTVYQPRYPRRDWEAGAKATLALMQQGVERITNGVLHFTRADGVRLVSRPNLLVKHPGESIFGDWLYVPTEIKLGKRPKLDYQITAAFHAHLLEAIQGVLPDTSWLVLRQRGAYSVNLPELIPRMEAILEECIQMLQEQREPEVFIAHNRCDLCHWFSHCYELAKADKHLSLLPGVTPSRYVHLQALELTTVETLAAATPKHLETLPGFGPQVAHKLVRQAQATLSNQALASPFSSSLPDEPLLSIEELPSAPIELYFDIEAAPEQNLVYLHGVLVVDRTRLSAGETNGESIPTTTETFYPLLADRPEDEAFVWQQFLDLVWRYPTAPIFHFCPYEVQTVKRLAEYYDTPEALVLPLLDRFVDLHERVTRVATLPVESYALKPIARWLGFNWRDRDANGAQSIYWYAQWLSTGDRAFLDAILRYNEDDCRATHRVKDWLVEFTQTNRFHHSPTQNGHSPRPSI